MPSTLTPDQSGPPEAPGTAEVVASCPAGRLPVIEVDAPLADRNTFGFEQRAAGLATARDDRELVALLEHADAERLEVFVLGGGSNVVLTRDLRQLVLIPGHDGIRYAPQTDGTVHVTAGAGTGWHDLVLDTLNRGLAGLENLSLIPGSTGAAPVQNIGAYGVELADRLVSVRALHRPDRTFRTLGPEPCAFGYRNSLFKRQPGTWIITAVTLRLAPDLPLVTDYTSLAHALSHLAPEDLSARRVSDAVIAIRRSKLPDPALIGNAGSFFQNPVVTRERADALLREHPDLPCHPTDHGDCKLAAGWLIDRLGLRGARRGGVGVHTEQALVMVNHGGGTGRQLMTLVEDIRAAVRQAYGIELIVEPVVLD